MAATSNIVIREALPADNQGLLELTSLTPMEGKIAIRIDRVPDFFRLVELRGPSLVMVAEKDHIIIASYSVSFQKVYVNGKPENLSYLADLKVHPDYRKSMIAIRMVRAAFQRISQSDADLLYCTVASGNEAVLPFFNGRAFLPKGENAGVFNILQIIPTPFKPKGQYLIEERPVTTALINFFDNYIRKYELGPVYTERSLEHCTVITAVSDHETVAAIALTDVSQAKQNLLIRLSPTLTAASWLIRAFNLLVPVIRIPACHQPIRIWYLKAMAFKPGHEKALRELLAHARHQAYENKFHFLNIGIHSKDPVLKLFSGVPKFTFRTIGYVSSLKGNKEKVDHVIHGIPYEDFSVV